jgi:tRNA pseudouridine55 synthase
MASGVLPIALGRATRLLQFLPNDKAYRATVRFGVTTTTDDLEGDVVTSQPVADLEESAAIAALSNFIGILEQVPPRYSAIQVQGKRLYDLARQGKEIEVPTRTVEIHHIAPLSWQPGDFPELTITIACGSGTYVRSIARDLGEALGVGATLAGLERTKSSGFSTEDSLTLEQLERQLQAGAYEPIAPAIALQYFPRLVLSDEQARRWRQGQKIPYKFRDDSEQYDCYQVYDPTARFLGITEWADIPDTDETRLLPKVVFMPP